MKVKIAISEVSHDDLVNLFSSAFYGNNAYYVNYAKEYDNLAKDGECWEDKLANIILNGGEIMVTDLNAEYDNEFYNTDKTSIKTSTTQIRYGFGEQTDNYPTYHINLQNIINGLQVDEAHEDVCEFFIRDNGDAINANCLMQYILFGELIYA